MDIETRKSLVPLAVLWTLLWTLLAMVECSAYIHDPTLPRWQPLALIGVLTAAIVAWLWGELRGSRYADMPSDPPRPWFVHQLRRLPALAVSYVVVVFGLRHGIFALAGATYYHIDWHVLIPFELVKAALFYSIWLGLVYGTLSRQRSRAQAEQLTRMEQALIRAQLARLQSQLRPHFLFNTLNTVSSLMQVDVGRADRVLSGLGDLLRANLGAAELETVPLDEELRLLRLYADIMQERFAGRVTLEWRVDARARTVPVPAMLLQPLLENAFEHGVEQTTGPQRIVIAARVVGERLQVVIHNTGSALRPTWRAGIGIANCRERLQVLYGPSAGVELTNEPASDSGHAAAGVAAIVTLPLATTGRAPYREAVVS